MALPNSTDLATLDFFKDGLPFVNIAAKSTTEEFFKDGMSFYMPGAAEEERPMPGPDVAGLLGYNAAQFFAMF